MPKFESPIQIHEPDGIGPYGDRWTIRNAEDGGRILRDFKTEAFAKEGVKEIRRFYNARKRADREIHSRPINLSTERRR